MRFPNPLIPGFNPDPSVVLADGVYYLVTSTFEYLPGIPVYRRRTWSPDAHRQRSDPARAARGGRGGHRRWRLGADHPPPRRRLLRHRHHRDDPARVRCLHATDPAGPWSDGVTIDGVGGIDPDLVWDAHPQFVGRRQRHLTATVSATADASSGTGGLAALRRGPLDLPRGTRHGRHGQSPGRGPGTELAGHRPSRRCRTSDGDDSGR
jgi:Glycosyl hydrolases family 43